MYDKVAEDIYYATMEKLAVSGLKRFGASVGRLYNTFKNQKLIDKNRNAVGGPIKFNNIGKHTKGLENSGKRGYIYNDEAALQALYHLNGLFGNRFSDQGIFNAMQGLGLW